LAVMARRLIKQGLPFSLTWTHPNGFFYKHHKQVWVKYYFTNQTLIAEYYRHYCREYYLVHGRGDPPISTTENTEGTNDRETVLWAAYGRRTTTLDPMAADMDYYASSTHAKYLAISPMPSMYKNQPRYDKVIDRVGHWSSAPNMYFFRFKDGRIVAVKEIEVETTDWKSKGYMRIDKDGKPDAVTEPLTSKRISAYALDKDERPKTKVFQRWPVATRTELLRLAKGSAICTPPPEEPPNSTEWRTNE